MWQQALSIYYGIRSKDRLAEVLMLRFRRSPFGYLLADHIGFAVSFLLLLLALCTPAAAATDRTWSPTEQYIADMLSAGVVADLSPDVSPDESDAVTRVSGLRNRYHDENSLKMFKSRFTNEAERVLSPDFLKLALTAGFPVHAHGVRIRNALFRKPVDLAQLTITCPMELQDCRFETDADFSSATFEKAISVDNSEFTGAVTFYDLHVRHFSAVGARFTGTNQTVNFNSMKADESINLTDAIFWGPVDFTLAFIGTDFTASGARFEAAETNAFNTMKVGEYMFLDGVEFRGPADFAYLNVDGDFDGSDMTNVSSVSFYACDVKGYMDLDGSAFSNILDMSFAQISLCLYADHVRFGTDGMTNSFNSMRIGKSALFEKASLSGYSDFTELGVGGNFDASGFTNRGGASFFSCDVKGYMDLEQSLFSGAVNFTYANIGLNLQANGTCFGTNGLTNSFNSMKIGGSAQFVGTSFAGCNDYGFMNIGINFEGSNMNNGSGPTSFYAIHVKGYMGLEGSVFSNSVDFGHAIIDGDLFASGVCFGIAGQTNSFDSMTVGRSVFLNDANISGQGDFDNLNVGKDFVGNHLTNDTSGLRFYDCVVKGHFDMSDSMFSGPVGFTYADIGLYLDASRDHFDSIGLTNNFGTMKVGTEMFFDDAEFNGPVDFGYTKTGRAFEAYRIANHHGFVNFNNCSFGGFLALDGAFFDGPVDMSEVFVLGNLSATGASFEGRSKAITLESAKVTGDASFRTAWFYGPVQFDYLEVGGDLYGGSLRSYSDNVSFNRCKVGGDLHLEWAIFTNSVDFGFATVNGNFTASGMQLLNSDNETNSFYSLKVGKDFILDGHAALRGSNDLSYVDVARNFDGSELECDQMCFRFAKVGGEMDLNSAGFGKSLDASDATISGDFRATNAHFSSAKFAGIKVGNSMLLNDCIFTNDSDFKSAEIGHDFTVGASFLGQSGTNIFTRLNVKGNASLKGASFHEPVWMDNANCARVDLSATWPTKEETLRIDGIVYQDISAGDTNEAGQALLNLLSQSHFDRAVYLNLVTYFQQRGQNNTADQIYYALQRREFGLVGPVKKLWMWILRFTVRYGRHPELILAWILGFIAIGTAVFWDGSLDATESKIITPENITNLQSLAKKLKELNSPMAQFLAARLSVPAKDLLQAYSGAEDPKLRKVLAEDLSRIILSGPIYSPDRFPQGLSDNAFGLMMKQPEGGELVRLNRMLLCEVLGGDISKTDNESRKWKMEKQDPSAADRRYFSLWYSLDAFAPAIDLQAYNYWKPSSDAPGWVRTYAKFHHIAGWILVPLGLAALTGLIK